MISCVAEVPGWDGPIHVSESLIQKIWWRQEFGLHGWVSEQGETIDLLRPGTWNHGGGPDFRGAVWRRAGQVESGDVEIHLRRRDWVAHGHDLDPAYDGVGLHVVLFPPRPGEPVALCRSGREPPTFVLLPHLWQDLETYAIDDALTGLTGHDYTGLVVALLARPRPQRVAELHAWARRRWEQKVMAAARRIDRLGWAEACHAGVLEALGYRDNRAAMLTVAARHPWSSFAERAPPTETLWQAAAGRWQVRGVRPANQPARRLAQYLALCRGAPDWPHTLLSVPLPQGPPGLEPAAVTAARSQLGLAAVAADWSMRLAGGAVPGPRGHNLATDVWLPLRAAADCAAHERAWALWFVWYPGDAPRESCRAAAAVEVAGHPGRPHANGWTQGLILAASGAAEGLTSLFSGK